MTTYMDGCIRIAENKYLTWQTSEMVRIFLGVKKPEDLTQLDGYEIKQETFVDPDGITWGTSNFRLIAKSAETQPQEIPLCPDEPGVFYFETVTIREGGRSHDTNY
ncbi:hypothetical protein KLEB271_gp109 [Bacillus phage vB_BauS_KLEB27-1]|nr:hypothetical protein KLEB271_gp109 [Bacillus phage vB_BauS_KLEB27-1]